MISDKDKKNGILNLQELVGSAGWNLIMVPWLEDQIRRNSNLGNMKTGSDDEILKEFCGRKIKIDVYRGVMNKPEDLIKELKRGGKPDGRNTGNT